jgi:membrane protease YdiL (CAAX protease family)
MTEVLTGMALESVAYALGLWGVSRALPVLLERLGVTVPMAASAEQGTLRLISYLGAGIYEEALFRQCLYAGAVWGMRWAKVPLFLSCVLAAIGSATLFSAAHHVGPYGQTYSHYVFLFRVLAGLYFALLFQVRGFGVAVGAHACYNVMISVGAG